MTTLHPQVLTRPAATERSRGAMVGVAIGVVTCAAMVAVGIAYTLKIQHLSDTQASFDRFPRDHSSSVVIITVAVLSGLFGIVACALAQRLNGWRIAAAVLGFVSTAAYAFTAFGCLTAADVTQFNGFPDSYDGWPDNPRPLSSQAAALNEAQLRQAFEQAAILSGLLALLALVAAVFLITGNSNGWYTRNQPQIVAYSLIPSGFVLPQPASPEFDGPKPAGWYPSEAGRLQWWNGTSWTEHFHDGN